MKTKRKGFTLIELLAVIVIITVIALITVPIVLNTVTVSEKKAFKTSLNEVKNNIDKYLLKNDLKKLPDCGTKPVSLRDITFLDNRKNFTKDSYMCYDVEKKCDYIYAKSTNSKNSGVIFGYGCVDNLVIEDSIDDPTADSTNPQYTSLSFNNTTSSITVNINWYDEESGIEEGSIKYAIKKHNSGNWSEWQSSNKFTKLKQNTDYTVAYSNNNKIGMYGYAEGTTKTLELDEPTYEQNIDGYTAEDKIVTIIYPEASEGETYTYSYSLDGGNTWKETIESQTELEFSKSGSVMAKVFDGTNYKIASTLTVSGIDKSEPSCSMKVVSGTLGSNNWYTSSSVLVKLTTSTAGESGIQYSSPIQSTTASYTSLATSGQVGESSTEITTNGTKTLYGYVKTRAGKTGKCSLTVKKDTNPTSVTLGLSKASGGSYTQGTYSSENVVLTAKPTATTASSGYSYQWYIAGNAINGATSQTYTATTSGQYKVKVTSGSGIYKESGNVIVNIDKCTTPIATISSSVSSGSYVSESGITLTASTSCSAGGNSGYSYKWYKNGSAISGATSNKYKATASGSYTVKVTVKGTGISSETSNTYVVNIDTDVPLAKITAKKMSAGTTVSSGNWSNENLNLTIYGSDASGIKQIYYCIGKNCDPTDLDSPYSSKGHLVTGSSTTLKIEENTSGKYIRVQTVDAVGKLSAVKEYIAKIDTVTPTLVWNIKSYSPTSSELYSLSIKNNSIGVGKKFNFNSMTNLNDYSPTDKVAKVSSPNISGVTLKCFTAKLGYIENMTVNSLYLGNYTIKCTATSGSGKTKTISNSFSVAGLFYPHGNSKNKILSPSGEPAAIRIVGGVAYQTPDTIRLPGYQYGPYVKTKAGCYMIAYIGAGMNDILSKLPTTARGCYENMISHYSMSHMSIDTSGSAAGGGAYSYFANVTNDTFTNGLETILLGEAHRGGADIDTIIDKLLIAPVSSTYCS